MDNRKKAVVYLLPFVIALAARLQNSAGVFSLMLPQGYDPYYHMRLVEIIVNSGHRPPFDYYLNYPYGLPIGWLPLFDYILATPGLLIGFEASKAFALIFPVLIGLLILIIIYKIAIMEFKNEYVAIAAILIGSITPVLVHISLAGYADYHSWNVFLFLLALYSYVRWVKNREILYLVLSSASLTLLAFSWLGAPIYSAIVAIIAIHEIVRLKDKLLAIYSAAIFIPPAISFIIKPELALLYVALAAIIAPVYLIISLNKDRYLYYYFSALVLALILVYFLPGQNIFKQGINYVLGFGPFLPTITEAKSLQVFSIVYHVGIFVTILVVLALEVAFMDENRWLALWFCVAFVLSLMQFRFVEVFAPPVVILAAYGTCKLFQKCGYRVWSEDEEDSERIIKRRKQKKKSKKVEAGMQLKDYLFVSGFFAIILLPSAVFAFESFTMSDDWYNALTWLKDNTPATSYYLDPTKKPEYSVLSWWDYGNWIIYVAKRPVVCNNFQAGAIDAAKFFTAKNEEQALKIAKKRKVRYIITDEQMGMANETISGKFRAIMEIAGYNAYLMNFSELMDYYNVSMFYKLHWENAENLKHFKLVKDFGKVKIFEVKT